VTDFPIGLPRYAAEHNLNAEVLAWSWYNPTKGLALVAHSEGGAMSGATDYVKTEANSGAYERQATAPFCARFAGAAKS